MRHDFILHHEFSYSSNFNNSYPPAEAYDDAVVLGPLAPFGPPSWNPFFARRGISFMCLMRPVPVVFLLFAFSLQLSEVLLV